MVEIEIATWDVKKILSAYQDNTLNISPEYQRRPVWKERDKILLLDSIARRLPIGAVTFFQQRAPEGHDLYEVIDGKQRLTALLDFLDNKFPLISSVIHKALDEDEDEVPLGESVTTLYDRPWSSFTHTERLRIFQYEIPVFIVKGDREEAVFAFYRMNKTNYALKPQEIRNAVFTGTEFLKTVIQLERRLSEELTDGQHFLGFIGAVSRQGLDRMQDIQLLSELLILVMHGPQHRRDTLDHYYKVYRDGPKQDLQNASSRLFKILERVLFLFGSAPLQSWHFPANCENDIYGLVGGFFNHGDISQVQFEEHREELAAAIGEFRRQVELFIRASRERQIAPDEFGPEIEEYGRTFFGGQINGRERRETRIRIWKKLIDEILVPLDERKTFSPLQRRLIWSSASEKICARCKNPVEWSDYEAGHIIPRAKGGRTVIENGQIEHRECNRQAGPN